MNSDGTAIDEQISGGISAGRNRVVESVSEFR
jgi:hypothetical protein